GEIEIFQSKRANHRLGIADEHIGWICIGIVRLAAFAMCPEIGHQSFNYGYTKFCGVHVSNPVHLGAGEQAMQEKDRAAFPEQMHRKLGSVEGSNALSPKFVHSGTSSPASCHRAATLPPASSLRWRGSEAVWSQASCKLSAPEWPVGMKCE